MNTTSGPAVMERSVVDTFVELADTLVEDFDLVEFVTALSERIVELGFATECGVLLADANGDLQYIAASHERTHLLELFQIQNREGPCLDCFTTGATVRILDLQDEQDRWPKFAPQALSTGFRSVQAVPLRLRGRVLGAMNLFLNDAGAITPDQEIIVQAMADIATIGLIQQRDLHRAHWLADQLQHALNSRIGIEQAKGVLAQQGHISVDVAFDLLRRHARNHNLKLSVLAGNVVDGSIDFAAISPARG